MKIHNYQLSVISNRFEYNIGFISKYIIVIAFLLSSFTATSQGFEIPETPKKQTSVYDYIGLLKPIQKQHLEEKLIRYSDTTSTQIVVAIINSTKGEYINYLATNWAHKWGIGQKDKDNGVFILLAHNDRKITIQTGYGVEHLLTDYTSRQIIEQEIIPHFKRGAFFVGLDKGTDAIFKVLQGEYESMPEKMEDFNIAGFIFLVFILFIIFAIIARGNKGNGGNYRGGGGFGPIILGSGGRTGGFGGGFGSSSGGFSGGFGGGGFGGGGATGSW